MHVPIQGTLRDHGNDFKLMEIKHEKLGLSYELPGLRQRDVEEYFVALRSLREGRISARHFGEEIAIFTKSLPKLDGERFGLVLREFVGALQAEQKRGAQLSTPENHGAVVRAATRCEWLGDETEESVDEMDPAAVRLLAGKVDDHVVTSLDVPGE